MKKALAIFITVCIIASLFVSCDNTTMLDELVSTRFDAAGSRSLIVSNENFIGFDDNSIKWQYMAVKVSDEAYNVGASSAWKTIPANGSDEGKLNNTIEFSQGKWNFELRAVKTTDTSVVIYYGKTEAPVLLEKQTSSEPQRIVINLTAQLSGQTGYIVLSNVSVKHTSGSNTETYDAPSKVTIDAGTDNEKVLVLDTDYSSTGTAINTIGGGYAIPVGTHTVKVQKIGQNNEILAEEEKTIEVYAGLKTTISNWIIEITQAGKFEPVAPTGTTSGDVSSAVQGNLTLTVENVTPSMVKGNNTTVIVPVGIFGSETANTTATVSIAVSSSDTIDTSDENRFIVTEGMDAVAALDLTLIKKTEIKDTEGNIVSTTTEPVTEFGNGNEVTITTYIAKNLLDPKVRYNNGTDIPEEIIPRYEAATGKLEFEVSHFSEYYVIAKLPEAKIGSIYYETLNDAISAANSTSGDQNVTVNIIKTGEYSPFTITRSDVTVQSGNNAIVTIKVNGNEKMKLGTSATACANHVTLKGLNFETDDSSKILFNTYSDYLTLEECSFVNNSAAPSGTALYIHYPNITIKNCTFTNWKSGYYTCGDNHAAGQMIFDDNTFTNVQVPIDGYWGVYKTDNTDIQITNNTFNPETWGTAYIQLWDYAQYHHYIGWQYKEYDYTTLTGTALNATVSGNTCSGNVVLYLTHCDWFTKSNVTEENNDNLTVKNRSLVELDKYYVSSLAPNGDNKGHITHSDGNPITDWNEHPFIKNNDGKYYVYTITPGDYTLWSTVDGTKITDFTVSEQETGTIQKIVSTIAKVSSVTEFTEALSNTLIKKIVVDNDLTFTSTNSITRDVIVDIGSHKLRTEDKTGRETNSVFSISNGHLILKGNSDGLVKSGTSYGMTYNRSNPTIYMLNTGDLTIDGITVEGPDAENTTNNTASYEAGEAIEASKKYGTDDIFGAINIKNAIIKGGSVPQNNQSSMGGYALNVNSANFNVNIDNTQLSAGYTHSNQYNTTIRFGGNTRVTMSNSTVTAPILYYPQYGNDYRSTSAIYHAGGSDSNNYGTITFINCNLYGKNNSSTPGALTLNGFCNIYCENTTIQAEGNTDSTYDIVLGATNKTVNFYVKGTDNITSLRKYMSGSSSYIMLRDMSRQIVNNYPNN